MKIFDDILKPEEEQSGYNIGEPDDDIFLLESQANYPVEIPDYEDNAEVMELDIPKTAESSPGVDDTIYDAPDDGSVWDIFDDPAAEQEKASDEDIDSMFSDVSDDSSINDEDIDDVDLESDDLESIDDIDFRVDTDLDLDDDILPNIDDANDIDDEPEPEQIEEEEEIVLDPDFLKSIKKELKQTKKDKSKTKSPEPIKSDNKPLFEADEKSNDEIFVDFASFKLDKPSTYNINAQEEVEAGQNEAGQNEDEQNSVENESEIISRQAKEKKVKKEKKDRKPLPLIPIAISAAAFVLLFIIGTGGYFAWNKYATSLFEPKTEQASEELAHKAEPKTKSEKEIDKHNTKEDSHSEPAKEETPLSEPIAEQTIEHKEPLAAPKHTEAPVKEEKVVEPKVEKLSPKPAQNELVKKKVSPPKVKRTEIVVTRKPKVEKTTNTEPKPVIAKKENIEKKVDAIVKEEVAEEAYVVQVYSSPSIEDAELWLRQILTKQIKGAHISPQMIRDQIWYRVRFGNFKTREEAISAASKYGYSQSWIDRIK